MLLQAFIKRIIAQNYIQPIASIYISQFSNLKRFHYQTADLSSNAHQLLQEGVQLTKYPIRVKVKGKIKETVMDHINTCYVFTHTDHFDTIILCSSEKLGIHNRRFNFKRQLDETLQLFLKRVETNVEKATKKKDKQKKSKDKIVENIERNFQAQLKIDDRTADQERLCKDFFNDVLTNAHKAFLTIGNEQLVLKVNAPWIEVLELPETMMAGFPVYAKKFECTFVDFTRSKFHWSKRTGENAPWQTLDANEFIYVPSNHDIGCELKLMCIPVNDRGFGPAYETISNDSVQAGPGKCPFETRHTFTSKKLEKDSFRVITYNVLADLYTDSDYSRNQLFPYCPPYALTIDYRKLLIVKELLGYQADIICLQEVDSKVYNYDITVTMSEYDGVFHKKGGGTVNEGLCTLYDRKRFKNISDQFSDAVGSVQLSELLKANDLFKDLRVKLLKTEHGRKFYERITTKKSILQVTALESLDLDGRIILVANVHFYFAPDSDHIRLFQGGLCIEYLQALTQRIRTEKPNYYVNLILCGDFNSVPECGIYELLTTGNVSETNVDWLSNVDERVEGINLEHSFKLSSACGTPEFTNFTAGFSACLDYIFYDQTSFQVEQIVPLPSVEELSQNTALPSIVFPSDHISLIADFKWKL